MQQPEFDPAFSLSVHCELDLERYERAVLSVPLLDEGVPIETKDLLSSSDVSAIGKYSLEEHLEFLSMHGGIHPNCPLLVLGMRNSLVNLRAPIIQQGRIYAVAGEKPERSLRPYYGLGNRDGRLVVDNALGSGHGPGEWPDFFCAGVPVLWDQLGDDALFDLMLSEATDHSHLFDLPRGAHPLATDLTRVAWSRLHAVFEQCLHADQKTISQAMRHELGSFDPPLRRCDNYFHAVIGEREDGALVCLFGHERLEELGKIAQRRGCRRAVCVENSGSIMPTWLPKGLAGEMIPLLRAPNFRLRGRAVMVFELPDASFSTFPSSPAEPAIDT